MGACLYGWKAWSTHLTCQTVILTNNSSIYDIYPIEHSNSNEWSNGMSISVHLDIKYSATLLNPLVYTEEFNYVATLKRYVNDQ